MTTGNGELAIVHTLNERWGNEGHAFRLDQRKGAKDVISDVILGIKGDKTISIEVKWLNVRKKNGKFPKPRPLNFMGDFSISEGKYCEIPHQLERQVKLSSRLGWDSYVLVYINWYRSTRPTEAYLLDSDELLYLKESGHASVKYDEMKEMHCKYAYNYIMRTNGDE